MRTVASTSNWSVNNLFAFNPLKISSANVVCKAGSAGRGIKNTANLIEKANNNKPKIEAKELDLNISNKIIVLKG
jgi:hypothetical protein